MTWWTDLLYTGRGGGHLRENDDDDGQENFPWKKLVHIKLSSNPLNAWSMPTHIGSILSPEINHLFLDATGMTGTIPTELFRLTNLRK